MDATLYGLKIFLSQDFPKRQLAADCPVTTEFRKEINAWMLEFFGWDNLIQDGQYLTVFGQIHMNRRTYAQLKSMTIKSNLNNLDWMK
jgi:hypothetical protein